MSSEPVVKKLNMEDAVVVTDLERKLFPRRQWNGYDYNKDVILNNNRYGSECALGLFHDQQMVGYLLGCPVGFSNRVRSRHEKKVYIAEFAVLPDYRRHLLQMLGTFAEAVRKSFPDRPVVTHSTEYYRNKWLKLNDFIRQYAFELKSCTFYKVHDDWEEKTLYCLRWEPADIEIHSSSRKERVLPREQLLFYVHRAYYKPRVYLQALKERLRGQCLESSGNG